MNPIPALAPENNSTTGHADGHSPHRRPTWSTGYHQQQQRQQKDEPHFFIRHSTQSSKERCVPPLSNQATPNHQCKPNNKSNTHRILVLKELIYAFFLNNHYIFKKTKLQSYDLLNIIIILRTTTTKIRQKRKCEKHIENKLKLLTTI